MRTRSLIQAALLTLIGCLAPGICGARDAAWPPPLSPSSPYYAPAYVPPPVPPEQQKRCGCWATHHGYGCGTFHSEFVFIFGSCRKFFGEQCLKAPPPLPYPTDDATNGNKHGKAPCCGGF